MRNRIRLLLAAVAFLVLVIAVSTATAGSVPTAGTVPTSSTVLFPLIRNDASPTPTVTPTPTPNGPFFSDDFSNSTSGWQIDDGPIATRGYLNGEYQIFIKQMNYIVRAGHNLNAADFQVNIDARDASSVNNIADGSVGVYFGSAPNVGFYDFEVADGQFILIRYDVVTPANDQTLIPLTSSSAINLGNAWNHLRATRTGSTITLYANGTKLAQINDTTLGAGYIGLAASSFNPNVDARFDNFYLVEAAPMYVRASAGGPSDVDNTAPLPALRRAWSGTPR